ncbi:MAG: hypothetical protein JW943_10975 [Deltaproteobacteria bacterium]|nr:hypothetical protein [Deltaproteobacteria bacterium]
MLDIITNIPNRTRIVKAWSKDGSLLGLTSVLLTPTIFMKHCFGQGNHIGTNNTFFFGETECRADVLAAILRKLTEMRHFGYYVGMLDDDLADDFSNAIKTVPHVVATKLMEAGSVGTKNPDAAERMIKEHNHLSRQIHRFANNLGTIHIHEGAVTPDLANEFMVCCTDSYRKHTHPGRPIDVDSYGGQVRDFLMTFPGAIHIYARLNGKIVGVQTFIRHERHLELTEGGFVGDEKTYHAYENIIVASARFAAERGLERVGCGIISNPAKDRLMDRESRKPVFLVMFFRHKLTAALFRPYRDKAHERFAMPYWRERSAFTHLPL